MQTTRFTRLPGMTLAVMLMLVGAQGLEGGPEAQAGDRGKLEGTWLIETTRVNCDTREPLLAPFPSVHTYLRGGTVLDIGAAPPLDPVVTRSAAHGIWERTGDRTFCECFHSFSFNAAAMHVLTVEVTFTRSLLQGKHAETDEIIGIGTGKFFTPAGVLVGEGCAEDRGRRFMFEEEE
jgi:hypothetical protein